MFADNNQGAKEAFKEWLTQGSAPTNGDIVKHDKIDVELLEHLAEFMWYKATNCTAANRQA